MAVRFPPPLAAILFLGLLLAALPSIRNGGSEPAAARQPSDAPVYLAMGDSLAFGVGAEDPASGGYVGRTHEALSDRELELVNVSVPGARSEDLLEPGGQLERALETARSDRIEMVSVSIGANDLLALAATDSPCVIEPAGPECGRRFSEVMRRLQDNLMVALSDLREAAPDARIYLVGLYNPFSGTGSPLEALAELGVQQVNGVIATVASDAGPGVEMVEIFDLFRGRGQDWMATDGLHPNDDGHRVISAVLLGAIEGREPDIPPELLDDPLDGGSDQAPETASDRGGTNVLLIIALPIVFLAGAALSAAYFLARGR